MKSSTSSDGEGQNAAPSDENEKPRSAIGNHGTVGKKVE